MNKKDKEISISQYVNNYIDMAKINLPFRPRDIIFHIYNLSGKLPYDGTITRIIRRRRENKNDVICVDKRHSIYARVL